MEISRRGQTVQASPIRKLKPYADRALEKGIKIYFLNIGDPDIPTPRPILDAVRSFNDRILAYGPAQGFLELRQAIADYFNGYKIPLTSENVIITCGGSEAILFTFAVVGDPGDEIIIPEPFYTNYNGYASLANLKIVPLTLKVENGYRLPSVEEIEAKITRRTKAILLCSPNNPTGTVYSPQELDRVVSIGVKHDLFLIGDEVYKEFIYDGLTHKSILEYEEAKNRVVVVDSISKRFSCCGARIGAVITRNDRVYQAALKFAQARLCPPTIEQKAAIAAYKMGLAYFEPVRQEYERRRDVLYEGLRSIPGLVVGKPQGAFYMSVRLPVKDAERFVIWMLTDFALDKETVMVAPGQGFYSTPGKGLDEIRIAYVLNESDLKRALVIFKAGLEKYKATVEA
ncbi:MAG: pyridoxal phosphate-dependent aminotransferase [Candidatus Aminicenantes bacterium]|nr:pyridoxal phosphate-dependent aminotransferase [Candidatus Aminicenantes bacterium]